MRQRIAMATLGAALLVIAAGCGSVGGLANTGSAGDSHPNTASSPAPSPPKAPPVTRPLSVTKFLTHPCDLLTKAQAKELGATKAGKPEGVKDPDSAGPICHWHNSEAVTGFSAAIIPGDKHGLDDIYRANQDPNYFAYFVPTTIHRYPGVFESATDYRDEGTCAIAFAVNDHLVLDAEYTGSRETTDPCAKVRKVASAVVTTIKENS
jgi:hypothetical protein